MEMPTFRYHPDPLRTGVIKRGKEYCPCCGHVRDFFYGGPIYAIEEIENVCPWCIADGSAHRKFDATFNDDAPLISAGLARSIVELITTRTPGFTSWQQTDWLTCCDDACEFWGDASSEEVKRLDRHRDIFPVGSLQVDDIMWFEITRTYEPVGSPAFYKFICRHCRREKFGWDCD